MTELNTKWNDGMALKNFCLVAVGLCFSMTALPAAKGEAALHETSDRHVAAVQSSGSIRANLALVAASAFEPAAGGVGELPIFGAKPSLAALNVPAPGSMAPAAPATDYIPEPGAIGFGLAVAALILGNFAKSLMRCWKITGSVPGREP